MSTFFNVRGRVMNVEQMRKWRAEQNRLSATFCHWCTSKGGRHMNNCLTKLDNFNPDVTPKLTEEERNNIKIQKDEIVDKGTPVSTKPVAPEGKLHGDDNQGGHREEDGNITGGNAIGGDAI